MKFYYYDNKNKCLIVSHHEFEKENTELLLMSDNGKNDILLNTVFNSLTVLKKCIEDDKQKMKILIDTIKNFSPYFKGDYVKLNDGRTGTISSIDLKNNDGQWEYIYKIKGPKKLLKKGFFSIDDIQYKIVRKNEHRDRMGKK